MIDSRPSTDEPRAALDQGSDVEISPPDASAEAGLRRRLEEGMARRYRPGENVRWVRASDLLTEVGGHVAGHGFAFTSAMHDAARAPLQNRRSPAASSNDLRTVPVPPASLGHRDARPGSRDVPRL